MRVREPFRDHVIERRSVGTDDLATVRPVLDDLLDNFAVTDAQGPSAYAEQMMLDHRELNHTSLLAEAVIAVDIFHGLLYRD